MRLLLTSFIDDNEWSGMGKWTRRVAAELTGLGHEVTAWFAGDFPAVQRAGRWSVLLFPIALALRIARLRTRFDVVVIHEPAGFWYGLLRRIVPSLPPMLLMCHNVESRHFDDMVVAARAGWATTSFLSRLRYSLARRWQSEGAIRFADGVLCLSSADVAALRARGVPADGIFPITNGADPFDTGARSFDGRSVLCVGGWLELKGSRLLPPIWERVRSRCDASLTLAGTGAEEETVLPAFAEPLRESVRVLPRVSGGEAMSALYRQHDVFLMPSLSEGSPLALLEAMAAGSVVIASRVGGIPDIVTDGANGLLFSAMEWKDAADLVVKALSDRAEASRLGGAAARRAKTLTWRQTAAGVAAAAHRVRGER